MKLDLPSNALLKWARDTNTIGNVPRKRLFRVKFDVDKEKMKNTLTENLINFEREYLTENIQVSDIVTNFNDAVQKSFLILRSCERTVIAAASN